MGKEELENLARIGKLVAEAPDSTEVEGLSESGCARLADARNEQLSPYSRFDLAYNASHALALAALRWHGYRSDSRYLVFQCLKHTLGLENAEWRVLDSAHRRRNQAEYEGVVDVDDALIMSMIRVATVVQDRLAKLGPPPA
ncbi:MAG: hypothetical protein KTR31_02655 [Myxococcales bacterium]|nr:hypothetical protein [Myxococcales bacterium]